MPFSKMSSAPGWIAATPSLQSVAGGERVHVTVDAALALGEDVGEVVARLVVVGAARDPLRRAVARLDRVLAGLAEERVVAGAADQVSSPAPPASTSSASPPCSVSLPAPPAASTGWVTWLVVSVSSPPARSIEMLGAIGQLTGASPPPVHGACGRREPAPVAADYVVSPGLRDRDMVVLVDLMVRGDRQAGLGAVAGRAEDDLGHAGLGRDRRRGAGAADPQRLDGLVARLPVVDAGRTDPPVGGARAGGDDLVQPGRAARCHRWRRRRASRGRSPRPRATAGPRRRRA